MNDEDVCQVDLEVCVECGICIEGWECPTGAIYQQKLTGSRAIRSVFSNPLSKHPGTGITGRGTEEMKTNDVTGRFDFGQVGIAIELGRPSTGAYFYDVQKVSRAVAALGVQFEPKNPVTELMNVQTGDIRSDVLQEKVLSAIVEFLIPEEKLTEVLRAVKQVSQEIDTVFSLDMIARLDENCFSPTLEVARHEGFNPAPSTKTNVGLGKISEGKVLA